jgi:hypothetical protein
LASALFWRAPEITRNHAAIAAYPPWAKAAEVGFHDQKRACSSLENSECTDLHSLARRIFEPAEQLPLRGTERLSKRLCLFHLEESRVIRRHGATCRRSKDGLPLLSTVGRFTGPRQSQSRSGDRSSNTATPSLSRETLRCEQGRPRRCARACWRAPQSQPYAVCGASGVAPT